MTMIASVAIQSCGGDDPIEPNTIEVTSVALNSTVLTMTEGETAHLTATVTPDNATDKSITWSSSTVAVASVDNSGNITAIKTGSTAIIAKAGNKTASCIVNVTSALIEVTGITLDKSSLTLNEGEYETLTATVKPDDATDKTITWKSDNDKIAAVDANGKVTAVAAGSTTITAKAGEKSATCSITVNEKKVEVTEITLNKTTLSLIIGDIETLVATVKPDNASDKTVTWSSNDKTIATVDANGKVTAVAEGTATITAKAGEKSAVCSVEVSAPIEVTNVTLNKTAIELTAGFSETLTATVEPDNATDKTVTWSSNDKTIATVDANGKVTAVAEGTATITATAGEKSATCTVKVNKVIDVTSITLNYTALTLYEGYSYSLSADVKPDDATDKTVTWSSDNSDIATVNDSGRVTAVSKGTATITAKSGTASATCTVTVNSPIITISDANFKAYLTGNSKINTNGDTEITQAEARNFTGAIECGGLSISSLAGISYFVNLTKLDCSNNIIKSFDLSSNTQLTELNCQGNALTTISISSNTNLLSLNCSNNSLLSINLTNNTKLTSLYCTGNMFTTLNLSSNTNLTTLKCGENPISMLSLSNNKILKDLDCHKTYITALDISTNTKLDSLWCQNNSISSLNLYKNTELTYLFCTNNSLSVLDVSKNTKLISLYCQVNSITKLDVSNNTGLKELSCWDNAIDTLDISKNTKLESVLCYFNQLSSLDASSMAKPETYELVCGNQIKNGTTAITLLLTLTEDQKIRWKSTLQSITNNKNIKLKE